MDLAPQGTDSPLYNPNAAHDAVGSVDPSLDPTGSTPPTPTPDATTSAGSTPTADQQSQEVTELQNYLVQHGYLSAEQVATGPGVYGPKTTAAVASMYTKAGIQAPSKSEIGQSSQAQLSQKYQGIFSAVKDTKSVDQQSTASTKIQDASQTSSDPVFGSMASAMALIMESLTQVINNIKNPALTAVSLQQEYNDLAQKNNRPGMEADLLNMQRIMTGTEDDIRDEVSKSGGTVTESQVLGMAAARNKVIMKQYNTLATQYQAAQTNIQNMMQYATTDQQTSLQREQITASVTEIMASIEGQMMSMGMTMQQNARQAVQYNVTQTGYTELAASAGGNPQVLSYYESMLNLAPGTLSKPDQLAALDTYKQQQLAIAEQNARNAGTRTYIYAASQGIGLPGSGGSSGTTFGDGSTHGFTIPPNALVRPSWLNANVPLSMSSADMTQYTQGAKGAITGGSAGTSQYGNNVTIQGVGNYVAQPDGSYILNSALPENLSSATGVQGLISGLSQPNPPTLNYSDIAAIMQNAPGSKYPPASTAFYREQRSARQLLGNFTGSPVYATVSQAPLPFARIQAARNGDNSVADTELLDSYITLAKGQGQITEAQIAAITTASSMSDKLNIIKQKVAGAGALISADQRKSLLALSGSVFDQYSSQYQKLYVQAINVLSKNHMEPAIWGVIPDFTTMITTGDSYAANAQPQ